MIRANCRSRFTADDFDFIVRALSTKPSDQSSLQQLLTDEGSRDVVLDDPDLARAILESPERIGVSPPLYFYILCRHVLKRTRVASRDSADYVASLLDGFLRNRGMDAAPSEHTLRYFSDMLLALQGASQREEFLMRAHIANYALFMSGIFAENLDRRAARGAPGISFYEQMGSMNFHLAAGHRSAKHFDLERVFEDLAEGFHEARLALNDLAQRLFHLDAPHAV